MDIFERNREEKRRWMEEHNKAERAELKNEFKFVGKIMMPNLQKLKENNKINNVDLKANIEQLERDKKVALEELTKMGLDDKIINKVSHHVGTALSRIMLDSMTLGEGKINDGLIRDLEEIINPE